nr:reverse transcriptase domain-containing protein [Tanacetum cinerariifolium]
MTSLTNSNLELKNMFGQFMKMNTASSSSLGTLPSNTITNPMEDLKAKTNKSSIDEPHEVELKDLPPHLEYAFLEGDDKLPVIIAKDLNGEEKIALIKLNEATRKDHFPLPFMDQMLERLAGNEYYCFLDGFSGYIQIPIDPKDQEKSTFTCPYETFAYRRMLFGLCNAPGTFQRCMMAIFQDMIEKRWKSSWTTSRFLGIHSKLASPI